MNYFDKTYLCFITSDGDREAKDIFDERIKKNLWPIYHRTMQFRKVKENTEVIFYLAGTGNSSQNFIAKATVDKIIDPKERKNSSSGKVKFFATFKNYKKFKSQINVRENLDDLTFIINKDKYGLSFQGGVTEMDETSYNYLINKSK
tara:strand:+ start:131 stop:571 length:441 start_codon:yes stop_codon:yes gene_type:complete